MSNINWNDYDSWRTDPDYDKDHNFLNDEKPIEFEYDIEDEATKEDIADDGYSYYKSIFQNIFTTTKENK
jgi:hypothetical protein